MQQVLADACALRLPVAPDAHRAVVDPVAPDRHIDGGVHLDAGDLCAAQLHHVVDVVDVVVFDQREHAAHASDDAALLAVVDVAAADDVPADLLLEPAVVLAAADGVALHLGRALDMPGGEVVVVVRIVVLAQRDARALAVADLAVLDDPPLGPVRADHAVLVGGGRRPCGRGLGDGEAADRDVADPGFGWHEAFAAHVDLHVLLVRIPPLEVRVDHGLAAVLFRIPLVDGGLRLPGSFRRLGLETGLNARGLIHHLAVEVDGARVLAAAGEVPIAVHVSGVRVVVAEYRVVDAGGPHVALIRFPVPHPFGAGDHRAQRFDAAVGDARVLGARVTGIDVFAVDARGDQHLVAGHGDARRIVDMPERPG